MLYNATNIKTIFDKKKTLEGLLIKKSKIIVSNYRGDPLMGMSRPFFKSRLSDIIVMFKKYFNYTLRIYEFFLLLLSALIRLLTTLMLI